MPAGLGAKLYTIPGKRCRGVRNLNNDDLPHSNVRQRVARAVPLHLQMRYLHPRAGGVGLRGHKAQGVASDGANVQIRLR